MDPHRQASAVRQPGARLVAVGSRSGEVPEQYPGDIPAEEPATPAPAGLTVVLGDRGIEVARRYGPAALRVALGTVFIWFGLLKVIHASPASDLIRDLLAVTVPFVPVEPTVIVLGVVELVIGLGFLTWIAPRTTLALFMSQMAMATGGTLLFLPAAMFQNGDPLLLSLPGEFVVKNMVLLAAGLTVLATVPTRRERPGR
jgi:putative oxidoreductase